MEILQQMLNVGLIPIIGLVLVIALVIMVLWGIKNYIKIPPNKAAIIFGLGSKSNDRGYRIVTGGATLVIPMLQNVTWLDLDLMTIPLEVSGAYSKEGVPVTVKGVANIRFSSEESMLATAAEQFGGKNPEQVRETARQTLLGGLRAVIGKQTVEELYQDREAISQSVQGQIQGDFQKMGINVQSLPIQEVTDEQGYLESLGKRRTAEVKRDAAIGEAEADRERREKVAVAERTAKEAELAKDEAIAIRERQLKLKQAEIKREVDAKDAEASQAGPLARARVEKEVRVAQVEAESAETTSRINLADQETARIEKELQFKVIKPAEAKKQAAVIEAEGAKQTGILEAETAKQTKIIQAEAAFEAAAKQADATRTTAQAEGDATATRGEGDAKATRARLTAEADGEKAKRLAAAAGTEAELKATASGKEAELLAEAKGAEAKLLAEAKGKKELALALAQLDQTGRLLQILDAAPKVAEAVGDALAKALGPDGLANVFGQMAAPLGSVDSIRMYDFGGNGQNGNGANSLAKFANLTPDMFFQFVSKAKALGFGGLLDKFGLTSDILDGMMTTPPTEGGLPAVSEKK